MAIAVGDAADGGLRLGLDLRLGLFGAVPGAEEETTVLHALLELRIVVAFVDMLVEVRLGLGVDIRLDGFEEFGNVVLNAFEGHRLLLKRIAAHEFHRAVLEIAAAHDDAHGHTLQFVVGKLEARTLVVGVVVLHADALGAQTLGQTAQFLVELRQFAIALINRYDNHLDGREVGRQDEAVVVGVRHDECAHQAGADAPRSSPSVFGLVVFIDKLHIEGAAEVLAEEVTRTALQRLAVLHHSLDGVGVEGAGETFRGTLHTADDGDGQHIAGKVGIDVKHLAGTCFGFLASGVCRVAFLPEELARAEEKAGAHFPAHHVAPLVAAEGQVAPGVNPLAISVPDGRLRGRTDDQFLLQTCRGVNDHTIAIGVGLQTIVGDDGALLGKSLHVLCLLGEERLRDEHGEIYVLHARFLKTCIKRLLNALPDGIAVGLDDHTAAHIGLFGQVGLDDQFVVPLRVVLASFCQVLKFNCHVNMLC